MLNALIAVSALVISEASSWDPASLNIVPKHATNPLFVPEEPATLTLALIGISILGAYVVIQRLLRPRRELTDVSRPFTSSRKFSDERRTRGAA